MPFQDLKSTTLPPAAALAVCSACGEPLGGVEACLPCLLRAGLTESDESTASADGVRFGDFEIERREDGSLCELGRGAMGVTYRAVDKVLHRLVALKVIEPPAGCDSQAVRERFLREARAAAALRHPNIAGVFHFGASEEINRCYCAMELVEGETLEARVRREGPLKSGIALEIAIQVGRALVAAAERDLVHRDLKPGNMLAWAEAGEEMEVKVIDFGLAKAANAAGEMELTHGGFVGTPAFASPEQFGGETIDARSDIYALGVALWFALTGRLPFPGATIEEIRERQARSTLPLDQLESQAVSPALINLLRSCLALNPAERPGSARDLLRALDSCRDQFIRKRRRRRLAALVGGAALLLAILGAFLLVRPKTNSAAEGVVSATPHEKGIAVLPFENLSPAKDDLFLADGIQDDIRTSLGKIKDLKIIARGSVMNYQGARRSGKIREIGRTLGVTHVLEGSVRRAGDRVAVNLALIDTRDERQVWAERYERALTESLSLQGELAVEIARALQATLSRAELSTAMARPTENAEAYLYYLRGREAHLAAPQPKMERAMEFYQKAVELDPGFALARARLSISASEFVYEQNDPKWQEKAHQEAEEALRLRPDLGEARLARAYYYLYTQGDDVRAMAELTLAAESLPNSAEVSLIAAFIHKRQYNYRERIAALQRAETLDPHNAKVLLFLMLTNRWVRDWPAAMHALDRRAVVSRTESQDLPRVRWVRGNDEFRLTGDIEALKKPIAEAEGVSSAAEWLNAARYQTAMLERNYEAAGQFLARTTSLAQYAFVPTLSPHRKSFHEALLAVACGSNSTERDRVLQTARSEIDAELTAEEGIRKARLLMDLALINAFIGRKEEAVRRAQESLTLSKPDSIERQDLSAGLALIHTQTGEPEKALDLIEHLLTVPVELQRGAVYNMTLTDLKWHWVWDPLRGHLRFQKILSSPEPKTVY